MLPEWVSRWTAADNVFSPAPGDLDRWFGSMPPEIRDLARSFPPHCVVRRRGLGDWWIVMGYLKDGKLAVAAPGGLMGRFSPDSVEFVWARPGLTPEEVAKILGLN